MDGKRLTLVLVLFAACLGVSAQDVVSVDAGDMRFTLQGYGQANYNVKNADGEEATNGFELTRVFLMLNAAVTPRLDMHVMLDVASKSSDKVLHEYWGKYKPCDALNVKFGQYKTHFTLENLMSPTAVGNIFFHDGVRYLAGMQGDPLYGSYAGRDFGLTLSGDFLRDGKGRNLLSYAIGVFNGTGMNHSENNTQKDVIAKLDYRPLGNLTLSASAYLGTGHALAADAYGNISKDEDYSRNRMSVGFETDTKPLYLRSEYLRGWDEGTPSQCFYSEAWLHVMPKHRLDVILDYEYFDRNIHLFDATRNYMGGLQWWFHKKCRISSLFQFKDASDGRLSRQFVTQLQLRF